MKWEQQMVNGHSPEIKRNLPHRKKHLCEWNLKNQAAITYSELVDKKTWEGIWVCKAVIGHNNSALLLWERLEDFVGIFGDLKRCIQPTAISLKTLAPGDECLTVLKWYWLLITWMCLVEERLSVLKWYSLLITWMCLVKDSFWLWFLTHKYSICIIEKAMVPVLKNDC